MEVGKKFKYFDKVVAYK